MRRTLSLLAAALFIVAGGQARAELLSLPEGLIALDSQQGEAILYGAEARRDYFPLSMYFVTQDNPAFCGPASISMVLNALGVARPKSDATAGFGIFDQKNIFTPKAEKVKAEALVMKGGMTLDQLSGILEAHGLSVEVRHAGDVTLERFRNQASAVIADATRYVLVNYLRSSIGQETGGHISPLAAYDKDTDRFLILDVSRYKYPPVWVTASALFDAMNTPDSDNNNKTRGYVIVGR